MNFIEATSYIGDPQGYADGPDFSSEVWPLIRRKQKEISNLFLFWNDTSRSLGWPGHYEPITKHIARIRPLSELTDQEIAKLEHWSFYGGHLNVLYQLSAERSLLPDLLHLYPTVKLSSDDVDAVGLGPEYLGELQRFTAASPPGSLHFSFAHDADPLYIFGDLESLRVVLRTDHA
jgi:hypothetical protein